MRHFARVSIVVMSLLFLLALVAQYNDPDPLRWMAIYGAAAAAGVLLLGGRLPRWLPVVVGLVALIWATALAPGVVGRVAPGDLFREVTMASAAIEEAREMIGLLIVAGWMLVLFAAAPRSRVAARGCSVRSP
jgi:hypothetical protein